MIESQSALEIAQVGETILRQPAKSVDVFDPELESFIKQLKQTMLDANGIGIAAPQVFDPRAIMIIASKPNTRYPDAPDMEPLVMINPKLITHSEEQVKGWEGCLSVPGLRGKVNRYQSVSVCYQDEKGKPYQLDWHGFLARIFQHEYDHLIGKTWLDRVESMEDVVAEGVYLKLIGAST